MDPLEDEVPEQISIPESFQEVVEPTGVTPTPYTSPETDTLNDNHFDKEEFLKDEGSVQSPNSCEAPKETQPSEANLKTRFTSWTSKFKFPGKATESDSSTKTVDESGATHTPAGVAALESLSAARDKILEGSSWVGRGLTDTGGKLVGALPDRQQTAAVLAATSSSLVQATGSITAKAGDSLRALRFPPAASTSSSLKSQGGAGGEFPAAVPFTVHPAPSSPSQPAGKAEEAEEEPQGVFGISMQRVCGREAQRAPVPHLVTACVHTLYSTGLQVEGLFRVEGSKEKQDELVRHFNEDLSPLLPEGCDAADVAGLLKRYLRDLPQPLLTFQLYDKMVMAGSSIPALIREELSSLPPANFATLRLIVGLLSAVAANSDTNKMDGKNLGRVLAPTFIWPKPETPTKEEVYNEEKEMDFLKKSTQDIPAIAVVIEHLIECYDVIFNNSLYEESIIEGNQNVNGEA